MAKRKKKFNQSYILYAAIIVLSLAAIYFATQKQNIANESEYQAVFLENDQIYFGQITSQSRGWLTLSNVYYLQQTGSAQGPDTNVTGEGLQLVKLGNEIHGPKNEMDINKQKVLFIEDLKQDSEVVTAIEEFNNSK